MRQSKDGAPGSIRTDEGLAAREPSDSLQDAGGQIRSLLALRARLVGRLAALDAQLLEARRQADGARKPMLDVAHASAGEDSFPLRGDEVHARRFSCPRGLDRADLERRLDKILVDERRRGRAVDGLEMLVRFQPSSGRVLSIETRRTGDRAWTPRFEATSAERPGPDDAFDAVRNGSLPAPREASRR